jgi:hypothetical protein
VEALGRSELNTIVGNAGVVIEHVPAQSIGDAARPDWRATVREHRRPLRRQLMPRLQQLLAAELPGLYEKVRNDTAELLRDHGQPAAANPLPAACPYDLDQITSASLP